MPRFQLLLALALLAPAFAQHAPPQTLARDIFKQLIEINTTDTPAGNVTTAAEAMAQRFRQAGFPDSDIFLGGPNDRKKNLVVRYHGTGAHRPVLITAHLDVVQALRSDWTTDPFQFIEKDGYFYGRGTQDMKDSDAIAVAAFLQFHEQNYKPDRDIILALTADEEGGKANGVDWLLKNHRDLIDAEFVLNPDAGGVNTENGKPLFLAVEATEKAYGDYQLSATNPGGHSSLPKPDNAIYHIADALARLQHFQFPFELNPVTRTFFTRMATISAGERAADMRAILQSPPDPAAVERLSADPELNAVLRTTCVATLVAGGHAHNALPQSATANVNCRIFPGHTRREIQQQLTRIFADPAITVRYVADNGDASDLAPDTGSLPAPPVRPELMQAIEKVAASMWPGIPVIPEMEPGASDAIYTNAAGMPTYGFSGVAIDMDDIRAHGKDERLRVSSFDDGAVFYYRFLKTLTSP